jgi:hypothetical protein
MPELFTGANSLNLLELPAARGAALAYPTQAIVSSTTWSSSPAGQANVASVVLSIPDSTVAQRQATAAATRQPFIQSITPGTGSHMGGTAVVISGWGFSAATAASFAGVNGTTFSVANDGTINVTTPAGSTGAATVSVSSPAGQGTLSAGFTFT